MRGDEDHRSRRASFRGSELQALRLAGSELAYRVPLDTLQQLLALCIDFEVPVRIIHTDRGARRTREGKVTRITRQGARLDVTGQRFVLRIRGDAKGSAWIVRRPRHDGATTSLELYRMN